MDFDFPFVRTDGADDDIGGRAAVEVEAHGDGPDVGGIDVACAPQAALFADAEDQHQRRMIDLLFREFRGKRDEHGATRTVVAAERGRRIVDDFLAFDDGLGAGAQRHRIEMGHEQHRLLIADACRGRAGARSGCRSASARECARWSRRSRLALAGTPDFDQRLADVEADGLFLAGDAGDGEETHQACEGCVGVVRDHRGALIACDGSPDTCHGAFDGAMQRTRGVRVMFTRRATADRLTTG